VDVTGKYVLTLWVSRVDNNEDATPHELLSYTDIRGVQTLTNGKSEGLEEMTSIAGVSYTEKFDRAA